MGHHPTALDLALVDLAALHRITVEEVARVYLNVTMIAASATD